ncbi:hypothetical protein Taro_021694 [Colocasia esculenta]|uniref:Uncharacterized protein n=1 Tax=Colocasia esculenta TaxID=4460 RepID=A0A843V656_COLES|nr:hypothetical protein [Colocasia esculenta]
MPLLPSHFLSDDLFQETPALCLPGPAAVGATGFVEEVNTSLPLALALPAPPSVSKDPSVAMQMVEEAFQGEEIATADNEKLTKGKVMDILTKVENFTETQASEIARLIGVSDEGVDKGLKSPLLLIKHRWMADIVRKAKTDAASKKGAVGVFIWGGMFYPNEAKDEHAAGLQRLGVVKGAAVITPPSLWTPEDSIVLRLALRGRLGEARAAVPPLPSRQRARRAAAWPTGPAPVARRSAGASLHAAQLSSLRASWERLAQPSPHSPVGSEAVHHLPAGASLHAAQPSGPAPVGDGAAAPLLAGASLHAPSDLLLLSGSGAFTAGHSHSGIHNSRLSPSRAGLLTLLPGQAAKRPICSRLLLARASTPDQDIAQLLPCSCVHAGQQSAPHLPCYRTFFGDHLGDFSTILVERLLLQQDSAFSCNSVDDINRRNNCIYPWAYVAV